jgi:UDP-2,4-diacetamido-2,4,6-trideoxy-beta-L-altropyranose hydrolase
MKPGTLMVRTDANVASGTGHVMRSLALAQAWRNETGEALFAMAQSTAAIRERLESEAVKTISIQAVPGSLEDLRQTIAAAISHNAEWLLLDGYHFNAHYLSELQNVRSTLFIDDNGELESYPSEFVLNQNAHARPEMYAKRSPRTRLLLGPSYALLRNEFVAYRDWTRNVAKKGTRILLTMGGSDPRNLTPSILSALAALTIDDLQIRVVVGGSAENLNSVAAVAQKFPQRVKITSNATNMPELMAWADLAIAGAGTTCWEICLLGLPAILVVVAENQKSIAGHLDAIGAAVNAGPIEAINSTSLAQLAAELLNDASRRLQMSQTAKQLVDGRGRDRVLQAMRMKDLSCA